MNSRLKIIAFTTIILTMSGCRFVSYETQDRKLMVFSMGSNVQIGELTAEAGDSKITIQNSTSKVDEKTVQAISDLSNMIESLLQRIPAIP